MASASIVGSIALSDASQCDQATADTPCTQVWQINVTGIVASDSCHLDGDYTFDWDYTCRSGLKSSCPVVNGTIPSIAAQLVSENLCSQITVVSTMSGSLESYSDNSFTTTQLAYQPNNPMFFMATLTSDVLIQSAQVVNAVVTVQGVATPTTIVTNGEEVDGSLDFAYSESSPNQVAFQFNAVYGPSGQGPFVVFDSLGGQDLFTFTLEVEISVTYQTTFGRKRDIMSKTVSFRRNAVMDAMTPNKFLHTKKASAAAAAGPVMSVGSVLPITGAVVALIAVVAVMVVIYHRRVPRS